MILSLVVLFTGPVVAAPHKDMIIVLDTSLSMAGKDRSAHSKNIFPDVKSSLSRFINKLDKGDTITFMTFDSEVKVYPTIAIAGDHDKDIINKYISMVEAKGKWTYTLEMVKHVLEKAEKLEKEQKNRQRVIVILTDGLDDPPPHLRKNAFKLKDVAKNYSEKDWFIYLVNLGDLKKNKRMQAFVNELGKVSPYTTIIDSNDGNKKHIDSDIKKKIDETAADKRKQELGFFASPIFYILVVIIIAGIVFVFIKRMSALKVAGKLDYWNHELLEPYYEQFDLTKQHMKTVSIGKTSGLTFTIRDLDVHTPFKLIAVRDKGKIRVAIEGGKDSIIEFVNKESDKFLTDEDLFKVKNYTFRYHAG